MVAIMKPPGHSGAEPTPDQLAEFEDYLTDELRNKGEGTLRYSMEHLTLNPATAKGVLPVYILGFSIYLDLLRLNLILKHAKPVSGGIEYELPDAESQEYQGTFADHRSGLENAYHAFKVDRDGIIAEAHLDDTTMVKQFGDLITFARFEIPSEGTIATAIAVAKECEATLKETGARGMPIRFTIPNGSTRPA
jgi:hypothetical protein